MMNWTALEWDYSPTDAIEAAIRFSTLEYELTIDGGKATVTLPEVREDVGEAERTALGSIVLLAIRASETLTGKKIELRGPRLLQYRDGQMVSRAIYAGAAVATVVGISADIVQTDSTGRVIQDTKAERIRSAQEFVQKCLKHGSRDGLLRMMLNSYHNSVSDPSNEFIYLYEIRDALKTRYGNERAALGITSDDWSTFGKLTNHEPVMQGRHRGVHAAQSLRQATPEELSQVRGIARRMILAYAERLAQAGGQT